MTPLPLPPVSFLRENFECDHDDGSVRWKGGHRSGQLVKASSDGHILVQLNNHTLRVQCIAWAMHHGEDPGDFETDHMAEW